MSARVMRVAHARQRYAKAGSRTVPVLKADGTPKIGRNGRPMIRRVVSHDRTNPLPMPKCAKCGDEIKVGSPYIYWEPYFRSNYQVIRCAKMTCYPRPSELDSSAMSTVLAAIENANYADTSMFTEASDFQDLVDSVVEAYDEVIEQYRDAAQSFGDAGPNAERADELEDAKSNAENVSFDDPPERDELDACDQAAEENAPDGSNYGHDPGNQEGCEACDEIYNDAMNEWRDQQVSNLQDALSY